MRLPGTYYQKYQDPDGRPAIDEDPLMTRVVKPLFVLSIAISTAQAQLVRTGAGPDAASIQAVIDLYRADLGSLNGNTAGSQGSGRREISWDGVPDSFSAPNDLPGDFFNINSPRGAVFTTPGSSVQVSADSDNPAGALPLFGNINPSYVTTFEAFSPERLFSPIGSNIVDLTFFVPGSSVPAVTRGFGAVYTDVDVVENTAFEYFGADGNSLGTYSTPVSNEGLSFLGVSFDTPSVARVRIRYGNSSLGPNDGGAIDVAVMDDFIYGEPIAIPEPNVIGACFGALLFLPRYRIGMDD
jgi:hypothetical protein